MKPNLKNPLLSVLRRNLTAAAVVCALAGMAGPVFAATLTWDANGTGAGLNVLSWLMQNV